MTSAEIDNSLIVGQLPQPSGTPEQFGLVLDKGSPLTQCVSEAVITLKGDGTLKKLEDQWLAGVAGAPVLS
jgi:polar amino acid transport system substrate-binding protein